MDGLGPRVVRTERMNRLGHTALGLSFDDSKLLRYRALIAVLFAAAVVAVPADLAAGSRLVVAAVAGLYVPLSGMLVYRRFTGDRADFVISMSDIVTVALCCAVIPRLGQVATVAITAIVVVAIPVHSRRLVAILAAVGVVAGGALGYYTDTSDWYLQPLVMSLIFPAFDTYFRNRRRPWEVTAERYQALIQASEVFFWEINLDTTEFVTAVGNCEGLLGYMPSELVGMRWTDFVVAQDVPTVAALELHADRRSVTATMVRRDGDTRVFRHSVERVPGARIIRGVSADISELAEATEVIRHQAERDHLTGLSNRMVLLRKLDRLFKRTAELDDGSAAALLMLDLNRFKEVNDTFGHPAGDRLLQTLAHRLVDELPEASVVARLGGDEFAVMIDGDVDRMTAVDAARRIHRVFQRKIDIDGVKLVVTPSIGIALLPEHATSTEDAIRYADMAMYESKRSDRTFVIYHEDPGQLTLDRLLLGSEIGSALDADLFEVWYHPRFDLHSGKLVGVESESRWRHPDQGTLYPQHFVELLEMAGELVRYGQFAVSESVAVAERLDRAGVTVNVSVVVPAGCLLADDWLMRTIELLDRSDVHPSRLTFRLTDLPALGDRVDQIRVLRQVADLGLGTAAAELAAPSLSPSSMRELPITEMKLGADFVVEINELSENLLFARALIELANLLGRTVVADGVPDAATLDVLRSLGCHQVQGPHLGNAMLADDLVDFAQTRSSRSAQPLL